MSSDSQRGDQSRSRWVALLCVAILVVVLSGIGIRLWQQYDPFFTDRPETRAAKSLLDKKSKKQPLTDAEFETAIALLDSGSDFAQISAIAILEVEAITVPARRARAIEALQQLPPAIDLKIRQAASQAASRIVSRKDRDDP